MCLLSSADSYNTSNSSVSNLHAIFLLLKIFILSFHIISLMLVKTWLISGNQKFMKEYISFSFKFYFFTTVFYFYFLFYFSHKITISSYFARKSHGDLTSYCLAQELKQKRNKGTKNVSGPHAVMLKAAVR